METETGYRVVRVRSRRFTVETGEGERTVLVPKKLRYRDPLHVDPIAVGDRVTLGEQDPPVVVSVLPRRNALSRPASGRTGRRQILAANLDLAIVVLAALEPEWKPATLDRYLVLASSGGVPALACVNKIDLDPSVLDRPELAAYPGLGIPVVPVSAKTGAGLEVLRERMRGNTCVLIGPSGAGKSSLINALLPDAHLRTAAISDRTGKGTHTTTWVEMLELPGGARLVDSPGLRVLDLSGVEAWDLAEHFPELKPLRSECRYKDCRHMSEPGCAVKRRVEEGAIAAHRYDSYCRMHDSLEAGLG